MNQVKNHNNLTWTIIGGGNGGQSIAGHLSIMGFKVKLYDIFREKIDTINQQGGIKIDGVVEGFGELEMATTNIKAAVKNSDILMVVTPAFAHKEIAQNVAPYLEDGQVIVLHPGATFGALEFKSILNKENCRSDVVVAETNTLIYACRCSTPGHASILGIKENLIAGAMPATKNKMVLDILNSAFPQITPGKNVLETSLNNLNAIVHPGPTLLSTSLIESDKSWKFYWDGITPTTGAFIEELDRERLKIGKALGINLESINKWINKCYNLNGDTFCESVHNNEAYKDVGGHKTLETRYVTEDVPMGLVPMVSLAKKCNVSVNRMETVINLSEFLLKKKFSKIGRTVDKLGLSDMTIDEIIDYIETGS